MADATLLPTASPKDLGKQLRAVRRRKGLSLSEVARGAGLSRRELVAYERGKVDIPESDLWVIAGSCGVDVAELVPPRDPASLTAGPETIEDTISQLRPHRNGAGGLQRHLDTLYALRALPPGSVVQLQERERAAMAEALGGDPTSIENRLVETMRVSRDEARRLRALVVPDAQRYSPLALDAAPPVAAPEPPTQAAAVQHVNVAAVFAATAPEMAPLPAPDTPTGPVDVFEELAKLPEPVALPDQHPNGHDLFSPPPEPVTVHADASSANAGTNANAFATWTSVRSALPEPSAPVVVEPAAPVTDPALASYGASHAPPIDVVGHRVDASETPDGVGFDALEVREPGGWQPGGWEPRPATTKWDAWLAPRDADQDAPPATMIEFVDELTPSDYVGALIADEATTAEPAELPTRDPSTEGLSTTPDTTDQGTTDQGTTDRGTTEGSSWTSWAASSYVNDAPSLASRFAEVPFAPADGSTIDDGDGDVAPLDTTLSATPWGHLPDPAASSTGFYVDWGSPDEAIDPPVTPPVDTPVASPSDSPIAPPVEANLSADVPEGLPTDVPAHGEAPHAPFGRLVEDHRWLPDDDPEPINWRPLADTVLAAVAAEMAAAAVAGNDQQPGPPLEFVVAGTEWELGNALPLVEVRSQGGLVMRRADERWALADVVASPRFTLEVDVDFRSGPGFGVLFCASTDTDGHMSGYSFDVDPIHEGGSYLVRQWHGDRELWNPIAHVPAPDPTDMHGELTLRVVVLGDSVTASVNGEVVLWVDSLEQACAQRNREPAVGDRVGIQAWSSSDLVIDELRVAQR